MAATAPSPNVPVTAPSGIKDYVIPPLDDARRARFGPRWTPQDIIAGIRQYSIENGWLEGTVWGWSSNPTDQQDVVFHTCLDTMAATLLRTKCIFDHLAPLSEADSSAVAAELRNVERTMGLLMHQFTLIRPLETLVMAWNVGLGLSEHHRDPFVPFQESARAKLTGPALAEVEGSFDRLNKLFDDTICVFQGPKETREQRFAEVQAAKAKWLAEFQAKQAAEQGKQ
ncbi:hypothetical protein MPH_11437 [Macrophomina phaseolina MS6]|uniref:Uncharacterized protein n=2 Tax=Macrophomina phaseolina TaxID=35725 RepID=K2RES1_MACPH|nr:hypothetical protein MPH_11437 [Macrophomina phaseolina MS6]KAH7056936.1 hypothetical protein B0J12DRAFT_783414 [Macrophomina phaseolina]